MKPTHTFAVLVAALALAGCDQPKQSRYTNDDMTPEVAKEAQEDQDSPKNLAANNNDKVNLPPAEVKKKFTPGQDIPEPLVAEKQPPVLNPETRKEIKDLVLDDTKAVIPEHRDQYITSTEKKFSDLDEEIQNIGDKIESLNADSYAKDILNSLHERRERLDQKFDELKAASPNAWMDFRNDLESEMNELHRALEEAKVKYDN